MYVWVSGKGREKREKEERREGGKEKECVHVAALALRVFKEEEEEERKEERQAARRRRKQVKTNRNELSLYICLGFGAFFLCSFSPSCWVM